MYRDAHSHLWPPTPAAHGTCGLIPRQKEALSTEGEGTEAETVVHMMCRAVNRHMRTLFPDTHTGAREGRVRQTDMRKRHMQPDPGRQK